MATESNTVSKHSEKLERVPSGPGVYLLKNDAGTILYVGKARNLRKRLGAYLAHKNVQDAKTAALIARIDDFETIVTASEKEALILESNLIKRHRPRYNVVLKDDKRYPSLRLDTRHPYPKLSIVRKIKKDGALYFGPYTSAHAVRQTLKIVNKTFMLRKCSDREFRTRTRPCLHCQMQGCLAPCCRDVERRVYDEMVKEVVLFLKGRTGDLIRKIRVEMTAAAERQDYERAAALRDKMLAVQKTVEKQVAVSTDFIDRDVIAVVHSADLSVVTVLHIRGGFLIGSRHFPFSDVVSDNPHMLTTFIRQYYEKAFFIPKEILVPELLEDAALLEEWLHGLKGRRVQLLFPQRGEKARLLQMAAQNAEHALQEQHVLQSEDRMKLARLQKRLKLMRLPVRIECYDNSNLMGNQPVAGRVVFENGRPLKRDYRIYRPTTVSGPDDYATMNEVLSRRFAKAEDEEPYPDLLLLDGGKGQLNIALAVLEDLGVSGRFDVVGIAKKDEARGDVHDKIYLPGRANPVGFGKEGDLLLFLQRVRDEAHRFAIGFHRRLRRKSGIRSQLDPIPGIGPRKKERLLRRFANVKQIRAASVEELMDVPGIHRRLAETIKAHLGEAGGDATSEQGLES
jgi:excinuclease ABC subunit C